MRYDARGHIEGMLEDTKEVIKSRKSKKDGQYNIHYFLVVMLSNFVLSNGLVVFH
jgi:hypothetical protein